MTRELDGGTVVCWRSAIDHRGRADEPLDTVPAVRGIGSRAS